MTIFKYIALTWLVLGMLVFLQRTYQRRKLVLEDILALILSIIIGPILVIILVVEWIQENRNKGIRW
jgi:tetrahydromethanopterin S-methyltransferase subunit E